MRKAFSIWAPPLIYVPIIFVLFIRPMPQTIPDNMDKIIHLVVYFFVVALFTRVIISGLRVNRKTRAIALALISSILLGTFVEASQHFIPYREASLQDLAANWVGALIGVSLYIITLKTKKDEATYLHNITIKEFKMNKPSN